VKGAFPIQGHFFERRHWVQTKDADPGARRLYRRHYSSRVYADGRRPAKFVGPGEYICLVLPDYSALFVWRRFIENGETKPKGINCAVFRNESQVLSSELILEAEDWARMRWPGEKLYTYVNGDKVRSTNPGYCFLCAGWSKAGTSKGGLIILEKRTQGRRPT